MKTVPVPGKLLRTDLFLGLTFNELVTLGAIPLVVVLPSLYIEQIPITVTIAVVAIVSLLVVFGIVQTPEGQTPLRWAPAAFKRRLAPDSYYLKPRTVARGPVSHLDVVHTAEEIEEESTEGTVQDFDR